MDAPVSQITAKVQRALLAWQLDLVSSDDLIEWLDSVLSGTTTPGDLPTWLLDLAQHGPDKCERMSSREFDFPWLDADFRVQFAAMVHLTRLADDQSVEAFVEWVSRECMGEDLDNAAVQLGYQLDHLANDCRRLDLAIAEARTRLPAFVAESDALVAELFRSAGLSKVDGAIQGS